MYALYLQFVKIKNHKIYFVLLEFRKKLTITVLYINKMYRIT